MLEELNKMHENLEFTLEKENDGKLPFLDVLIKRNAEKFSYEIYRKPTDAPLCTPCDSHTPMIYKTATFESMFHRLFNIPLDHDAFQKELKYIYEVGERNGYDRQIIERIQKKHQKKNELKCITTLTNLSREAKMEKGKTEKGTIALNYCPPLTDKIRKVSKKYGIGSYYTARGTLGDLLINLKDKREDSTKSGIYEVKCGTRLKCYSEKSFRF